jgi:hypothetical protein
MGGCVSGGVLIVFGIAVIALGIWGFNFTRDHIEREGITFGSIEDPAVAEHAEQWAGEPVDTGRKALAQAEIMREHTLSDTGGLTYAEMGRYQSADDPSDPAGTNDSEAAATDENGEPISNSARNIWVTETALATALSPHIGYAATAEIAKESVRTGRPIREVALERGLLDAERLDQILSVDAMTRGGVAGEHAGRPGGTSSPAAAKRSEGGKAGKVEQS